MERREGGDPFLYQQERLHKFAKDLGGKVFCPEGGHFHLNVGDVRAEIYIDSMGKVSYELFGEDGVKVLAQDNTDLETIVDNVKSRVTQEKLNPSAARQPLGDREKLSVDQDSGKIRVEENSASSEAA